MSTHKTAKGEHIDMEKLRSMNATMPALGNAKKNARGDKLGPGGVILKTQEQIYSEIASMKSARLASVKPVDIKSPSLIPDNTPVQPISENEVAFNNKEFDSVPPVTKRRKIIETDK